MLDGRLYIA